VRRHIYKALRDGDVTPIRRTDLPDLRSLARHRAGAILGNVGDIGHGLTHDQCKWLVDEIASTGCRSVSEYLTEIVRDLHAESTLAKETK